MLARGLGQLGAAEHSGHFLGPLFPGDEMDAGPRTAADGLLLDQVVMVGEGGDLRQMGDAKDLVRCGTGSLSFLPTASAARPPIPVSISSKTRVRCAPELRFLPEAASTLAFSASITRDNSPPEAMCSICRKGSPGLVAIMYST